MKIILEYRQVNGKNRGERTIVLDEKSGLLKYIGMEPAMKRLN